jgi:tetratricopeptide (TPR) repeat protein/glycosyltransferase involved in cell wall biosynthesis
MNDYDLYTEAIMHFNNAEYYSAENLLLKLQIENKDDQKIINFLGVIKLMLQQYYQASEYFKQAIKLYPNDFNAHYNLGLCYQHLKKYEAALEEYQETLKLNPTHVEALLNSGAAFAELNKDEQAERCYNLVLKLSPDNQKALTNLGNLKLKKENFKEAEKLYQSVINLDGEDEVHHYNLGNCFLKEQHYEKALDAYKKSLKINPKYLPALNNMGLSLSKLGALQEAIHIYFKALAVADNKAEIYFNIAKCYQEIGKNLEAISLYTKAVDLDPNLIGAYVNIGDILLEKGQAKEAEKYYRLVSEDKEVLMYYYNKIGLEMLSEKNFNKALRYFDIALSTNDDNPDIHYNKSHIYLLEGEFDKGWREYEWRVKRKDFPKRNLSKPILSNEHQVDGKTILVYDEQGIGDSIQFARYLSLLKEKNAKIIFECYDVLMCIYKNFNFIDRLIEHNNEEPKIEYDYQISLLSLPNYFGTTLETIPGNVPYIFADNNLVNRWSEILNERENLKIGLVWRGRPTHGNDKNRSSSLKEFSVLFSIKGIKFYSLQKGEGINEIDDFAGSIINLNDKINDLADTAAIISNLDLVITVDTSIAHLAGAMGKEVWVLIPYLPDWRWLIDRQDSPWYPSMKLFRQDKPKDWEGVLKNIDRELKKIVDEKERESSFRTNVTIQPSIETIDPEINKRKLYLGLSSTGDFGWGIVNKYLKKELSDKIEIYSLEEKGLPSAEELKDAKVFQLLMNNDFNPLFQVRGKENFGYTVFENELTDNSIENARNYDIIFTASSWCERIMNEKGINNTEVLIQGVDPKIFFPVEHRTNENLFVIFSGGKFELRKGQDIVLKAIQILQQKYKDIILINAWYNLWPQTMISMQKSKFINFSISGKNWLEIMHNIYQLNNLDENRIFTLPLTNNQIMRDVYIKTDLGLFPNRCEGGTNLVMMEYMACGKPVVASFNTGHKDILKKNNSLRLLNMNEFLLYNEKNEVIARWEEPTLDEIIYQIEFAYNNRDEIKKLGKQAAMDMLNFTWTETANVLLKKVFKS